MYINKRINTLMILFSSTLILGACSSNVEEVEYETSNLEIKKVSKVRHLLGSTNKNLWNDIPNKANLDIKTCLTNPALGQSVSRYDFDVKINEQTTSVTTQTDGCIQFPFEYEFNYLEDEKYISFPIEIVGTGDYVGFEQFELAINPWSGDVIDSRFEEIPSSEEVSEELRPLTLESINFQKIKDSESFIAKSAQTSIKYNLAMKAVINRYDLNKSVIKKTLTNGSFDLELKLVKEDLDSGQLLTIATQKMRKEIRSAMIQSEVEFRLNKDFRFDSQSSYLLVVKASPINAQSKLKAQLGAIRLNQLEQNNESVLKVTEDLSERIQTGLNHQKAVMADKEALKAQNLNEMTETAEIDAQISNISLAGIIDNSFQTKAEKQIRANIEVCLQLPESTSSSKALKNTKVKVDALISENNTDGVQNDRIHTTDQNGCFSTYTYIKYNQFACEQWLQSKVVFEVLDGRFEGATASKEIAFNPWNKNNFAQDLSRVENLEELNCQATRFHVKDVNYKNQYLNHNEFKLNKYMHLVLHKEYDLKFPLATVKGSSSNEETLPPALTFGEYEASFEIFTPKHANVDYYSPNMDNFTYLTSTAFKVTPNRSGIVNTKVSLPFQIHETAQLSYKNLGVLTIKAKGQIAATKVIFPFYGTSKSATLATTEVSLQEFENENSIAVQEMGTKLPKKVLENFYGQSTVEIYREEFRSSGFKKNKRMNTMTKTLSEVNESIVAKDSKYQKPLKRRDFRLLSQNPSTIPHSVLKKTCGLFYYATGDNQKFSRRLKDCLENPHKHIERVPLTHIIEIARQKTHKQSGEKVGYAKFASDEMGQINRG